MPIHPLKGRKVEVRFTKDEEQPAPALPEYAQQKIELVNRAEDIQDIIRVVSANVILGVGSYVVLDTLRKAVVKMVPGH